MLRASLGEGATLGLSAIKVGGVRLLPYVDCFKDLSLPMVLFYTSCFCCIPVHCVLLLASLCGSTILWVLLHCILVFFQSFLWISTSLPNVYLFTFATGNLIHHTFSSSLTAVFTLINDCLSLWPDLKTVRTPSC